MSKFRCPYCFEEHELEDCVFVCPKDKCPRGFKNDDGSVSQQNLSYCLGRCKHAAMQVSCPEQSVMDKYRQYVQKYQISAGTGTDLSLDIPESIRKGNKTLTVAIVGGVYSGKSTYITTLINKLDVELNNKFGTSLSPLNTATEELYRQRYSNYIYKSNTVNDKTRANETIPPLMYRLEIPDERFPIIKKKVNLVFYDTAGEELRASEHIAKEKGYVPNADLIILLLDPLQMDAVRERYENKDALPPVSDSPTEMINRIANVIKSVKKPIGKIGTPIAMAFSKVDILEKCGFFGTDKNPILEESSHLKYRAFSMNDHANTQEIMSVLFETVAKPNPVKNLKNQFRNYALFGFSAIGGTPDGGEITELNTYRVLDPILWLLNRKHYIKTHKEEKIRR